MITGRPSNWAGNVIFRAAGFRRPSSVEELQAIVARAKHVRAIGAGHSFSRIADTTGELISVDGLPKIMEIDTRRATVTVSAGVRYAELASYLHRAGFALTNLASLPQLSVAGACATATHGSGNDSGNLATAAAAIQMVTADGEIVVLSRKTDPDWFAGAVVGLGALGIVTTVTLDIVASFDIRQYVYDGLPLEHFIEHLAEIFASAYSVSVFTDFRGACQVWQKRRMNEPPPPRWLGAQLAAASRHPVPGMSSAACTAQLGVPGPWHERLPHFRAGATPSVGAELQSEYLVPRHHAADAIEAVSRISDLLTPVLRICEIRTVAKDDLWLSPSYQRDSAAIHFTLADDPRAVAPVLAAIEAQLEPFGARPHWGKLFSVSPKVMARLYPRAAEFRKLLRRMDPDGKFRNELTDAYFPG